MIRTLPFDIQNKNNIPMVTYLGNIVRNKLLNCKETVNSIIVGGEVNLSLNTETCECEHSQFCNPRHKYMIIEGLCIFENS